MQNESHLPHVDTSVEGRAKRCRREPVWMIDYEKGEGLSYEDNENAMMAIEDDPVTFVEAIKSRNWQYTMERERWRSQKRTKHGN